MPFSEKLAKLRKRRGLTQQELAQKIGVGIAQMRRYEKGSSSPTLEVIKNIAKTLSISSDELIFDEDEPGIPRKVTDRKLLEQFEMISKLSPHDKDALETVLESMIIKNRLEEIMPSKTDITWSREMHKVVSELKKGAEEYSDEEIEAIVDEAVKAVRAEEKQKKENNLEV